MEVETMNLRTNTTVGRRIIGIWVESHEYLGGGDSLERNMETKFPRRISIDQARDWAKFKLSVPLPKYYRRGQNQSLVVTPLADARVVPQL